MAFLAYELSNPCVILPMAIVAVTSGVLILLPNLLQLRQTVWISPCGEEIRTTCIMRIILAIEATPAGEHTP
jgi:hypothetical protein